MKYAIVTVCNDAYLKYSKVLIKSFFYNNQWFDGDFIVLYDGKYCELSDESINALTGLHENVICKKYNPDDYEDVVKKFKLFLDHERYNVCFLKYEIFKMDEYDKIVFLDSDMVVIKSIRDLFDLNIGFGAAVDNGSGLPKFYNTTLPFTIYFNAGMFYFGNKTFLSKEAFDDIISFTLNMELGGFEEILTYSFKHIIGGFPEQDALNKYFIGKDNMYLISSKYNTLYYGQKSLPNPDNTAIIHYLSKPDVFDNNITKIWHIYENINLNDNVTIDTDSIIRLLNEDKYRYIKLDSEFIRDINKKIQKKQKKRIIKQRKRNRI